MYRVRPGAVIMAGGYGSVITTHCDDNSSNTTIGDRTYANFNPSFQHLSSKGLLAQRNNDYMKFSWDPMQATACRYHICK
ncbi:hypothetical protein DPMN_065904 [Dreissena polymorpha]|uniref:Uncharacterized protein n=1 Tax=Dreissena polymorpha TaxID=45954 RepID=A0A9D4BSI8_DREPO|nr:hypothetical protein DPMN_065904 [Dreissena polymorpha]